MQAKDPSENILTTRQVCDLVEELVGKRPSSDQIREWCRQGYIAPEELPPIHLEHVRNRLGHYEITEESVRHFIEMRRRRENNLLAFVKWCKQKSAQLQTKGDAQSSAAPTESPDAGEDEPASDTADPSSSADLTEPTTPQEPTSKAQTTLPDVDHPQSQESDPEDASQPVVTTPVTQTPSPGDLESIPPVAADADLLGDLVVEKTDEEIEDDFFSTFVEDDQDDVDSDDRGGDEQEQKPAGGSVPPAITVVTDELPETEAPRFDAPEPEIPQQPLCDFASFAVPADMSEHRKGGLRSWRSRRVARSAMTLRRSQTGIVEQSAGDNFNQTQCRSADADEFSLGIFESVGDSRDLAAENRAEIIDLPIDARTFDTAAPAIEEMLPAEAVGEQSNQTDPKTEPIADGSKSVAALPVSTPDAPPSPVAPRYSLPPIKPLPPNSPLRPDFGPPRVASPLRPRTHDGKPAAKPQPNNNGGSPQPAPRTKSPAPRRTNARHSAQLDQLAKAYAAYTAGAATAPPETSAEPKTGKAKKSSRDPSSETIADTAKTESLMPPSKRRDLEQETQAPDRVSTKHNVATGQSKDTSRKPVATSMESDSKSESKSPHTENGVHPRAAAQVSRYLWLWVTAIAIGWVCFGLSFMVKDDFGVIALSSITVAATGMSGLWWTGK